MVRVTDSPVWFGQVTDIQDRGFHTAIRASLSLECWESTWARGSVFFSKAVGGGSESRDPHMPAQGGGRKSWRDCARDTPQGWRAMSFRALMFVPRCFDERFPEWLDVRLPCATTERDFVKCQSSTSLPRNKLFLSVSR